jgi:pSer/pThr/pTyr-binding forkhead associated (FHA) protein
MARLVWTEGTTERIHDLTGTVTIGREPGNAIVVDHPKVSRAHARLEPAQGGGWVIEDLGSGNGTLVNGNRISRKALASGDLVEIGGRKIRFDDPAQVPLAKTLLEVGGPSAAQAPLPSPASPPSPPLPRGGRGEGSGAKTAFVLLFCLLLLGGLGFLLLRFGLGMFGGSSAPSAPAATSAGAIPVPVAPPVANKEPPVASPDRAVPAGAPAREAAVAVFPATTASSAEVPAESAAPLPAVPPVDPAVERERRLVADLRADLQSRDRETRWRAYDELRERHQRVDPVPLYLQDLRSGDDEEREKAARALGRLGDRRAIRALEKAKEDDDERSVRNEAEDALEKIEKAEKARRGPKVERNDDGEEE